MRVGILGGGQLGRMLALAGFPLDIRCQVFDPAQDACAGQVCKQHVADYDDMRSLFAFVQECDVVTFEFENIPVETVAWIEERVPVFPPSRALKVTQDRLLEKQAFLQHGIPTPEFRAIDTEVSFREAIEQIGIPSVLKTRRFGYDGKGQFVIRNIEEADAAWMKLGGRPLILEEFVPFDREVSLIAARGIDGAVVFYPLVENQHIDGILHRSLAPAPGQAEELQERAQDFMIRMLTSLDYVGVLTIEFFQSGPRLFANEMAPRVHNSGHWTIEGAITSQFENHLRAICNLPLGSTATIGASAMYNFIGHLPEPKSILNHPLAHFHSYGKEARPGRKVGHVTLSSPESATILDHLGEWDRQFSR